MLSEPVRDGYGSADRSADQEAFAAARKSADEHSSTGSNTNFGKILVVVALAFELTLRIDVGLVARIGVNQRSIQNEFLPIRKHHVFREDGNGGLSGNATGFIRLCDATLDGGSDWYDGFTVDHDWLGDSCRKRISGLGTEGCERGFQFHLDGGAGWKSGLRSSENCDQDERRQ